MLTEKQKIIIALRLEEKEFSGNQINQVLQILEGLKLWQTKLIQNLKDLRLRF